MNKLRKYYSDLQSDASNNFDKITPDRLKKLFAFTNQEYEAHIQQGQYDHLDQLAFYQDKFGTVQTMYKDSMNGKTKKPKLQADVKLILADNFGGPQSGIRTPQPPEQEAKVEERPRMQPQVRQIREQRREQRRVVQPSGDPKEMLNSFFAKQRGDIQKKKVGFKSIIETIPKASQKHIVRSKMQMQRNNNDDDILKMNSQIQTLNRKLQQEKESKHFNQGLYDSQKRDYENRVRDLVSQIQNLNTQNQRIKNQQQVYSPVPVSSYIRPNAQTKVVYEYRAKEQEYNPHHINYRQNNLQKINQKNQHQFEYDHKSEIRSSNRDREDYFEKAPSQIRNRSIRRQEEEDVLMREMENNKVGFKLPMNYQQDDSKSNLRFNKSQAENEDKNLEIRSKMSFFRSQIVLFRGHQIQVALKCFDLVDLTSRKIYIFINNKDKYDRSVELTYDYDPAYYGLEIAKQVREVKGLSQSKEQIQVYLKDQTDFDSMIEVKLRILHTSHKQIKFLLPAMFIEFTSQRPQKHHSEIYEKNFITPYHQFSSVYLAMEMLPFEKYFEENIEVVSIFARSKNHEGYIILRYKTRGEIQVETIRPWKLFISYLLSRKY